MITNRLIIPCLLILCSLFSACSEDEPKKTDDQILFSLEENSAPENLSFDYYSPDPHCVPPLYWIKANKHASELTIKITNGTDISISKLFDPEGQVHSLTVGQTFHNPRGFWSVTIVDATTVKFIFDEVSEPVSTDNQYATDNIYFSAKGEKAKLKSDIFVQRALEYGQPIN